MNKSSQNLQVTEYCLKGIIGANPGNEFNISGVAYESSLSAYRVFGCTGDTTDDSESYSGGMKSIVS